MRTAPRRRHDFLPLAVVATLMVMASGYVASRLDQAAGVDPARQARFESAVEASAG